MHEGLIIMMMNRYKGTADRVNSDARADLIQEGWCAVIKNIRKHEPSRGSISTYLCLCIEDSFKNYLRKSSTVRRKRGKVNKPVAHYMLQSEEYDDFKAIRAPSSEDICEGMQQAEIAVDKYLKKRQRSKPSQKYIEIKALTD